MFKLPDPTFIAEIHYLTEAEGGRHIPILSGYSGQFFYDDKYWIATQEFIDKEICEPGETILVKIQTMRIHSHVGKFYVGKPFEIREGSRIVGLGTITHILHQSFQYWDFATFYDSLPTNSHRMQKSAAKTLIQTIEKLLNSSILEQPDNNVAIKNIKNHQNLTKKNEMLAVQCQLSADHHAFYQVIEHFCDSWEKRFSYPKSLYQLNYNGDTAVYTLIFALQDQFYVTGKIDFMNHVIA